MTGRLNDCPTLISFDERVKIPFSSPQNTRDCETVAAAAGARRWSAGSDSASPSEPCARRSRGASRRRARARTAGSNASAASTWSTKPISKRQGIRLVEDQKRHRAQVHARPLDERLQTQRRRDEDVNLVHLVHLRRLREQSTHLERGKLRDMWERRRKRHVRGQPKKKNHRRSLERMCSKKFSGKDERQSRRTVHRRARRSFLANFLDGSDVVRPARPRAAERPERVDLTATFPGCLTTRKRGLNPAAGRFRFGFISVRGRVAPGAGVRVVRALIDRARGFFAVNARSRRVPQRPAGASH